MDTVLLRKMSYKSVFNFGKYNGLTVQHVLDLKKTVYIRYLYFHIEGISFADDILKQIGVFGDKFDFRIEKPGTNEEYFEKINSIKFNKMCKIIQPAHAVNKMKMGAKIKMISTIKREKNTFSKSNMQRRNHGR